MNLFGRKAHTIIMCNLVVPFVCTGFLGIKTGNGIITGSTTEEAHEISLTTSDTEPVSHYWEGEENKFAFIAYGVEAVIDQQETTCSQELGEESVFAFITKGIEAIIEQQEKTLNEKDEKKVENNKTVVKATKKTSKSTSSNKKTTTTKNTSGSKTTSVVTKKEVATSTTYNKPSSKTGESIVSFAKQFVGLRYRGGTPSLKTGADCSGFTMLIYKQFGVSLPRTVGGQLKRGTKVAKSDLQKGDLVFFKKKGCKNCGASHVAIYIGGGQVIHETRPGRGVAITKVDGLSNITFYAARRIIGGSTKKTVEKKVTETKTDNVTTTNNTKVTNEVTTTEEKKNENVNNNVVEVKETTTTNANTTETHKEEIKQDVKTDTSKEEVKVVEKVETKKEESKEEVVETKVSNTESN